ncbi:MAG: CDGSH-type Zn-finger protein, partial [Myxococcota bacterium]
MSNGTSDDDGFDEKRSDDDRGGDPPTPGLGKRKIATRAVCICDLSKEMPWCDGSHSAGTKPILVRGALAESGFVMC